MSDRVRDLRIDHNGGRFLRRGAGGGFGKKRQAADFQHGAGKPVPSFDFTGVLIANTVALSMVGKGTWRDNVFVERIWRSVKYEEVYLHAYDSVS
jgi:putative transposase